MTDFLKIEAYVAVHGGDSRAVQVVSRLRAAILTLAATPDVGSTRPYLRPGALAFPIAPWVVIYRRLPTLDGIRLVPILGGRRDLTAVFGKA